MKVTGFTIIKNAIKYDFPIREAIESILPICDEVVVAVGDSNDGTRELVEGIAPGKVKILDTVWDKALNVEGRVLADETNKAFQAISADTDWCFYIQADEAVHEKYLDTIYGVMKKYKDDLRVDGLLFKYLHFYGSYDYVGASSNWYSREIRVIRNDKSIYSYKDAQGFRKGDNQKLVVKPIEAYIYHYGWVREPKKMNAKLLNTGHYWGGDTYDASQHVAQHSGDFDYSNIDSLKKFTGTHPKALQERINRMNWKFEHDLSHNNIKLKDRFKNFLEKLTGRRFFDYQNYKILK